MPSNPATPEPIELIIIGQAHRNDGQPMEEGEKVIYSQFRILQIAQSYPNAAFVVEGYAEDFTEDLRETLHSLMQKALFPESPNFQSMHYEELCQRQKKMIFMTSAAEILFNLQLTSTIYQGAKPEDGQLTCSSILNPLIEAMKNYPSLRSKAHKHKRLPVPRDLDTISELRDFEECMKISAEQMPEICLNREREALHFVLNAASKSKKKQVVLIYGVHHLAGFLGLIKAEFSEKIILKACLDSTEGFDDPDTRKIVQLKTQEAQNNYKDGNYQAAVSGYTAALSFWKATPRSTPKKLENLLVAEYNLGSSLYKLAAIDPQQSYEDSLAHLEYSASKNPSKYQARYSEALKRHHIQVFFKDPLLPAPCTQLIMSYADETAETGPSV